MRLLRLRGEGMVDTFECPGLFSADPLSPALDRVIGRNGRELSRTFPCFYEGTTLA
jgi:hypothetical protein